MPPHGQEEDSVPSPPRGEGKKPFIMISTYDVGGGSHGGLYNTEKTSSDSTVSYYTHGQ